MDVPQIGVSRSSPVSVFVSVSSPIEPFSPAANSRTRHGGVAGRTVADATTGELVLATHAQLPVLGTHRQHDGAGAVLGVSHPHAVHATRLARQLHASGVVSY